jgi:hypothetical protein
LWVVREVDGVALRRSLGALLPPLSACLVMVLVVLAVRSALASEQQPLRPVIRLLLEVLAGGIAYLAAVAVVGRRVAQELVSKLRVALRPRVAG